ncbi:MAG: stage II sporulation protein M [Anaerolineales bacterium]|nr:stage II sporulation protein M [Anaerolineales bacterium]MCB8966237.1 stage II sporulation protein M [Ardenticatenaceae bacterium]
MTAITTLLPRKNDWQMAFIVTRREVRDAFRDWRIIIPIFLLTLAFPALMNFTAGRMVGFVEEYGADIIANQLIPFLLLVVGFFPMSFSLVIALETFVGEKERKSLEPLLATPLTNMQLYMGKMMASLVPPLLASYAGMTVYLIALKLSVDWSPTWQLFVQTLLITTIQGFIMVAGAVIISSQTTSVRAANLLASFIIIPMALLIQFEAVAMFWGNHSGLWWLIFGLVLTALVLMRMGTAIFNREELLGRDIDQIRLGWMWQQFWTRFSGKSETGYPNPVAWYRQTFAILGQLRVPIVIMILALIGGAAAGVIVGRMYVLPAGFQAELRGDNIVRNLEQLEMLVGALPYVILAQNVRVLLLMALLGVFTFGVLSILIFMLPIGLIGYIAAQFALAGQNPYTFLLGAILPHAVIEIPALLIAAAAALRWHITVISPPPDRTLSEGFLIAAADFVRLLLGVAVPLLVISAFVEAYVTPQALLHMYGG